MSYERSYGTLLRIADRIEQLDGADACTQIAVIGHLPDSRAYSADLSPEMTGYTAGLILRADKQSMGQSVLTAALNDYCSTDYTFATRAEKQQLLALDEVRQMPLWPQTGSVAVVGDTIVIRAGEGSMQMTELPILYFHADDYGMTAHGDALIRDCQTHGCLNSVSIVPNGSLEEAVAALRPSGLKLAVHLNLVEGKALSPAAEIPLLVQPDGSFCNSFTGLLRLSLTPRRRAFAAQLYRELERQLLAYAALFPAGTPLRIDSHQHTHMIPLVFRTLLQVLADHHLPVEHLRIPSEPLSPFVGCPRLWGSYSAVNAIKQAVLNGCWLLDRPAFRRSGIPTALFCGILFSGHMDADRVRTVLPQYLRLAQKRGQPVELLFHPGGVEPGGPFFDPQKTDFHPFYLSEGRAVEAHALHTLSRKEVEHLGR